MIVVEGGEPLIGAVRVAGAKNAALPAIFASLLTQEPVVIQGVPDLLDVETALELVQALGKKVERIDTAVRLTGGEKLECTAPKASVQRMRASFLALGPILARAGVAHMPLPGGCAIGARPVDLHLKGLAALGANIDIQMGVVHAVAPRLQGTTIILGYPSVGATEQLLLAGALAQGKTTLINPAREPEVWDLARMLAAMGADVQWYEDRVIIWGKEELGGAHHQVIPDRIEAGTYLIAGAITRGKVRVDGVVPAHLVSLLQKLGEMGAQLETGEDWIEVRMEDFVAVDVEARPYPGFPTDLQPPIVALLALARGKAVVKDTVFNERFGHVDELIRMGANIRLFGPELVVEGVPKLRGAQVRATDIRAGAALILAGLAACGTTLVEGTIHIRRGYDDLPGKLRKLGARIWEEVATPIR